MRRRNCPLDLTIFLQPAIRLSSTRPRTYSGAHLRPLRLPCLEQRLPFNTQRKECRQCRPSRTHTHAYPHFDCQYVLWRRRQRRSRGHQTTRATTTTTHSRVCVKARGGHL
ncbi:uncharacterized protein PV07_07667 [Cladophialophora immunda]|uniref:Uncharacterized protein n=1 Tax=Cladophialophora immunda TaxID=569365 RepID=A0A0D2CWH5_9EURO|nr:uncharacterized protein PV07_07667 [Cladophialophora immunda]KIW27974.1 hypothetical protein PV07_07667 [Cladophialophora immunda]